MASNVKLKDIGELKCETRHEQGEWVVYYEDPDQPAGITARFGGGLKFRTSKDAVTGLAQDLRKRGYTGSMRNMKPAQATRNGVAG
jgi:hypothetical protein